jgi:WD40 repeat protein
MWRTRDAARLATFSGPWEKVFAVALPPEHRSIVVLADQNLTYTVDIETQAVAPLAQGPAGIVHRGRLSDDGRIAVSVLGASTIAIWDTHDGNTIRRINTGSAEVAAAAISRDRLYVAWGDHSGVIRIVELSGLSRPRECWGHRGSVEGLEIVNDDRCLVSVGSDHTLRLWDMKSSRCLVTMEARQKAFRSVACTPNGQLAITGSDDGSIDFWQLSTEITFRAAPFRLSRIIDTESSQVIESEFNRRLEESTHLKRAGEIGKALAAALAARSVRGCDRRAEIMEVWRSLYRHTNLLDLSDMCGLNLITMPDRPVTAIAHVPRTPQFLLGLADGSVHLFDQATETMTEVPGAHSSGVRHVVAGHNGKRAATFADLGEVAVWTIDSLDAPQRVALASSGVSAVDFSPDSRYLAIAEWQIDIVSVSTGASVATHGTFGDQVRALTWMPDGDTVLVAAGESLYVCDLRSGSVTRILDFRPYQIASISVSSDGRYVLGAGETLTSRRGGFFLWDAKSKAVVMRNESLSHSVRGLSFLPDGRHFLLGTDDGVIRLWHVDFERSIRTLSEFSGSMSVLAASHDNRYAFALNQEGAAKIWALDWQLGLERPDDAVERLTAIADCDKRARESMKRLEKRWRKAGVAQGTGSTLPSLQRRIENGGLGGVSAHERRQITQSPRWWYKK